MNDHAALMSRAATVIDSLDDINEMAVLGGPLDELAFLVRRAEVFRLLGNAGLDVAAFVAVRAGAENDPVFVDQWLRARAGLSEPAARAVAEVSDELLRDFLATTTPFHMAAACTEVAAAVAVELESLLAPYGPRSVPDLVPVAWSDDAV